MSQVTELTAFLCCPRCRGDLTPLENELQCTECRARFPINDGIACLMPQGSRLDRASPPRYHELNHRAEKVGWKAAVLEHIMEHYSEKDIEHAIEYICSEARADFRFLMPVDSNSVVLDIGSDWGNITTAFARTSACVITLDTDLNNLRFTQLRTRQEKLHNVIFVQGDIYNLPIRPGSCDAALMVGMLERPTRGQMDDRPHRSQKHAFMKVYHALKPGGCLYLATENRFSFKYLLRAKEPRMNLRFMSLLSNGFASGYSKPIRGQEYKEVTFSPQRLHNLLCSVGFDQIDFFFSIPSYQNIRFLADLKNKETTRFVLKRLRTHPRFSLAHYLAGQIMLHLPLHLKRLLWPSFSVLAMRP